MPAEQVGRAVRRRVSGGGASVGARLSAVASMAAGLVAGLVLAVVCALLMLALSIVTDLGRAAQDGLERLPRRGAERTPTIAGRHLACQIGPPPHSSPR